MKKYHAASPRNFAAHMPRTRPSPSSARQRSGAAALAALRPEGVRYTVVHTNAHTKPRHPVVRNTHRHPRRVTIAAISGGAITAPTLDPVLNRPNAKARSSTANHSATAL